MNVSGGIYLITNLYSGQIYIGSTVNFKTRFSTHRGKLRNNKHHNKYLQEAWNRFGESGFLFEVLEEVQELGKLELEYRERHWINLLHSTMNDNGYNIVKIPGRLPKFGMQGRKHTEETKRKMSEARLGMKFSDEHKANMSRARKRIPLSAETKAKRLNHKKYKGWSEERKARQRGPNHANFGKKVPPEVVAKRLATMAGRPSPLKGRKLSDETKKKLSDSHKGLPANNKGISPSEEVKKKISESLKKYFAARIKPQNEIPVK